MLLLFCFRTEEFYEFVHIKIHWFELHIWCDCIWIVTKVGFKKDHIFPNHRFVVIIAIFPIEWISKLWNPSDMCVIQTLSPKVLTLYLFGVFMCVFSLFLCVCYMSLNVLFEMRFFFRPQYLYAQRRITFLYHYWQIKTLLKCQWREEWTQFSIDITYMQYDPTHVSILNFRIEWLNK